MLEQATSPGETGAGAPEEGPAAGQAEPSLAEQRRKASTRTWVSVAMAAFVVVLAVVIGSAWAFGGNRIQTSSAGEPSAGFAHVLASSTATSQSGVFLTGAADGVQAQLSVPAVGVPVTERVALSAAGTGAVHLSSLSAVPSQYRSYHAVAVFGVVFEQAGREVLQELPATLSLTGSSLSAGDVVMLYSPKAHTFDRAGDYTEVVKGQALIRLRTSADLAVLAP